MKGGGARSRATFGDDHKHRKSKGFCLPTIACGALAPLEDSLNSDVSGEEIPDKKLEHGQVPTVQHQAEVRSPQSAQTLVLHKGVHGNSENKQRR